MSFWVIKEHAFSVEKCGEEREELKKLKKKSESNEGAIGRELMTSIRIRVKEE